MSEPPNKCRCRRFTPRRNVRTAWSIARAAAYGGGLGALAALLKTSGRRGAVVRRPRTCSKSRPARRVCVAVRRRRLFAQRHCAAVHLAGNAVTYPQHSKNAGKRRYAESRCDCRRRRLGRCGRCRAAVGRCRTPGRADRSRADTAPGAVPEDIRSIFPVAYANRSYFWPLTTTFRNGEAPVPFLQPRVMGGGSSVMGMIALRGLPHDYGGGSEMGARNWGWPDVLPTFQAMTNDLDEPAPQRNARGPNVVRRLPRAGLAALHAPPRGSDQGAREYRRTKIFTPPTPTVSSRRR